MMGAIVILTRVYIEMVLVERATVDVARIHFTVHSIPVSGPILLYRQLKRKIKAQKKMGGFTATSSTLSRTQSSILAS